ncbi:hypothetical protein QMZ25_10605 [Stenotrophomonas sp. RS-48]|uniref:hypothetical protein n=1 Tax=Stenotrophomonas sp. RS-48 TaxID=3043300 RepID=UPI0024B5F25E|nr:hypothetical protein [Stenotrophomonas sp. RS-48]MDI9249038.1 hypothetical protein [Stenotrophomonas sp. RS-48]
MDTTERRQGTAGMTKERPILFNGAMVRAILAGQKTQTRRAVKVPPAFDFIGGAGDDQHDPRNWGAEDENALWWALAAGPDTDRVLACPFGKPGDRLWVRETWAQPTSLDPGPTVYRADYPACVPAGFEDVPPAEEIRWRPSIHMPRGACRLVLEITDVRVERLQEISEADAIAEGADVHVLPDIRLPRTHPRAGRPMVYADCREIFADLWDSTGGDWNSNPWVWAITFKRIEA